MKTEEVKRDLENGLAETVKSGKYVELLDSFAKFHQYSFTNTILIMFQKQNAGRVAGYRAWETKFDRHVKKGAKAIWIYAPNTIKKKVVNDNGEEEEKRYVTSFRVVPVFSEYDTEGAPLPDFEDVIKPVVGDLDGYDTVVEKLKNATTASVKFEPVHDESRGFFRHNDNAIIVKAGMSQKESVKTLVHEIAHSILHCDGGSEAKESREIKELEAESVAYIVCRKLGFDTGDYSFGYVATWAEKHTMEELRKKLDIIGKTADKILEVFA